MAKFGVDPFGGWVLKCDPTNVWDLASFLADGGTRLDEWSVKDNKRSQAMSAGQPVAFWVSGDNPECPPGLWSIGAIDGAPRLDVPDEYWLESGGDLYVPVDLTISKLVVPRATVAADPDMAPSELIRMRQMSNPIMLTTSEWAALERLYHAGSPHP